MAVDEQHQLTVAHEVTRAVTDQGQLVSMAARTTQTLGVEMLEVVAPGGYYDGAEVRKCETQGLTDDNPKPQTSAHTKLGLFGKEHSTYNPEDDSIYGIIGSHELTPYHAAKGAAAIMTKQDAVIYGRDNIRVTSIHPGTILMPLVMEIARRDEGVWMPT